MLKLGSHKMGNEEYISGPIKGTWSWHQNRIFRNPRERTCVCIPIWKIFEQLWEYPNEKKKWFCSKFGRQIPRLWNEYYCCILDSHVWVIQKKRNKTEQREKQGWWWRRLNAINFLVRESSVVISVYSCTRKWCVSFVILFGSLSNFFKTVTHLKKIK